MNWHRYDGITIAHISTRTIMHTYIYTHALDEAQAWHDTQMQRQRLYWKVPTYVLLREITSGVTTQTYIHTYIGTLEVVWPHTHTWKNNTVHTYMHTYIGTLEGAHEWYGQKNTWIYTYIHRYSWGSSRVVCPHKHIYEYIHTYIGTLERAHEW